MIDDVSDTALWIASYRAQESERPDALFRDPLAARLAGEKGRLIAERMSGSPQTGWSVVMRTCIIDGYLRQVLPEVDTVVNLGAGLDTRPYRLELPESLRWIEVDYPRLLERKAELLRDEKPRCRLERVPLDLADRDARRSFLGALGARVLVLTEGVTPYLSNDEVASLAEDLRASKVRLWINDYNSPLLLWMLRRGRRKQEMKNAPFRFEPGDWFAFFARHGWKPREVRYYSEESERTGRAMPRPWWGILMLPLMLSARRRAESRKLAGYVLLEPS